MTGLQHPDYIFSRFDTCPAGFPCLYRQPIHSRDLQHQFRDRSRAAACALKQLIKTLRVFSQKIIFRSSWSSSVTQHPNNRASLGKKQDTDDVHSARLELYKYASNQSSRGVSVVIVVPYSRSFYFSCVIVVFNIL